MRCAQIVRCLKSKYISFFRHVGFPGYEGMNVSLLALALALAAKANGLVSTETAKPGETKSPTQHARFFPTSTMQELSTTMLATMPCTPLPGLNTRESETLTGGLEAESSEVLVRKMERMSRKVASDG